MNIDFNKACVLLDVAEKCTFYPGKFSSLQSAAMQELINLNMEIKEAAVAEAERALAEAERAAEEQQKAMAAILAETVTKPEAIPTVSSETTQTVTEPTTMPEAVTEPTAITPVERKI